MMHSSPRHGPPAPARTGRPALPAGAPASSARSWLVPTPPMVEGFVRSIPWGRSLDLAAMCAILAERHGASSASAEAVAAHLRAIATEGCAALERGADPARVTPFWRVRDAAEEDGFASIVRARRRAEGLRE